MLVVTSNNGKLIIQLEWPNMYVHVHLVIYSYSIIVTCMSGKGLESNYNLT